MKPLTCFFSHCPSALAAPVALLTLMSGFMSQAVGAELKLSLTPNYTTGTYGSGERTNTYEVPLKVQWRDGPWVAAIRIPYLQVTGPQSSVPNLGVVGSPTSAPVRGLDDIRVYGGARVLGGREDSVMDLELGAGSKLPTGDASRGLGTGQFGIYTQAIITLYAMRDLSVDFTFGRLFRTRHPSSPGLRDFFYGFTSIDWNIASKVTIGAALDVQQKSVSRGTPVLEAGPYAEYQVARNTRVGVSAFWGFTRNSSAFGCGLLFSRRFQL